MFIIQTSPRLGYNWLNAISAIFQPYKKLRTCIIHISGYEGRGSEGCRPIPTRRGSIRGGGPHQGEESFLEGTGGGWLFGWLRTSWPPLAPSLSSSSIIFSRRWNSGGHRCGGDIPRFLSLNLFKGLVLDRDVKLSCFVSANRIFNFVQRFRHCLLMVL